MKDESRNERKRVHMIFGLEYVASCKFVFVARTHRSFEMPLAGGAPTRRSARNAPKWVEPLIGSMRKPFQQQLACRYSAGGK